MHVKFLECVSCSRRYSPNEIHFRCSHCNEDLEVVYNYNELKNLSWDTLRSRPFKHWRYREFFPVLHDKNIVTLGEGGTPLIKSKQISKELGLPNLYFKIEGLNPTGSFKDRGSTVEVSKALELGVKNIACASTGNMGASVSAYCTIADIKANIFAGGATKSKIKQITAYGAQVKEFKNYKKAQQAAVNENEKNKTYLMGDYPYRGEGEKSVGFELADQLGRVDYVVCPIGNGALIHGIWKGLVELKEIGLITHLPHMVGIQANGCAPIVRTFNNRRVFITEETPRTAASAIAVGNPLNGLEAVNALQKSRGLAESVSDKEMLQAKGMLASKEGIYAELSGAAPLAGLIKLMEFIEKDANVVLIVTGHGLKDT